MLVSFCAKAELSASSNKLFYMSPLFKPAAAFLSILFSLSIPVTSLTGKNEETRTKAINLHPKIQAAILLDVSNSMDGLIEQAKAQLWNMVSVMGKAKCDGVSPQIEIALYEYGRSTNNVADGYVKQISSFTSDLDKLSQDLFKLNTNGGDEYCGHVIHTSLNELAWDTSSQNYKVIFIAGNEDFLQGDVLYTTSCAEAKKKGVIVNTIYCGDRMQGIKEHWNLAGECGNGSFTNINQDAKVPDIPTPYDTTLIVLNSKLNGTYLFYGEEGRSNYERQGALDFSNASMGQGVAAKRAAVKASGGLYYNGTWDLVDAARTDSSIITKVDLKTLPDSLKNKSRAELKKIVDKKNTERGAVQKEILQVNTQRENYIAAERAKAANNNNAQTLESEVEKVIRQQAKRFNMIIQ
jgi:hypothetical protein